VTHSDGRQPKREGTVLRESLSVFVVLWEWWGVRKKFLEPCAESETRKTGLVLAWSLALRPGRGDFPADQKDNQDARADDKQGASVLERIKRSCC
jgi:hypothetical protein